ncbi:MAG: class I SAM-dependent methyltransferase [Nitrososphaerota archaeon]
MHWHDDAISRLISDERKKWQNPERIINEIGLEEDYVVCDLACGPGFFTLEFASRLGNKGKVYAVDASAKMLDHLRKEIASRNITASIIIINSDVLKTEIPSVAADLVFFANVLHDIDDKKGFLREVKRICKKKAKVVDIDWHKDSMGFGPPYGIRLSEEEALKMISDSGFKFVRRMYGGDFHYGLLFSNS